MTSERLGSVTASPRNLPERISGCDDTMAGNEASICPAIMSAYAGPMPLYGTCVMRVPVIAVNNSPVR